MSHKENRSHWFKEGMIGMLTGSMYGITNVAVGHPFDTLKTKMQAQAGFEGTNMFRTCAIVLKTDGIRGLYRGAIPPLWGSGIYRSLQFSSFEAVYTYCNNPFGKWEIPLTQGLQLRVVLGGCCAGTFRALLETPLEYVKTHRQTAQNWKLKNTYTGFQITWLRSSLLLPIYFSCLDTFNRHFHHHFDNQFVGPFLNGGIASIVAWTCIWPLEYMRTQVQAGYMDDKHMTVVQRLKYVIDKRGGVRALYRGIGPGLNRSFFANGFAMIIMQFAQRKISELGLRD